MTPERRKQARYIIRRYLERCEANQAGHPLQPVPAADVAR